VVSVNGEEVWGKYIWTQGRVGEDRGSKETDGCPLTILFGFPLARQVLYISFILIYIFTLDFPWLDLSGVFSLE
jgi:hypothetical protein